MADRIDVIALKAISLGGVDYQPEDRIAMGASRVRQYELIERMGRDPVIRRADAAQAPEPALTGQAAAPPARPAAVVNASVPVRRYRTRRLKSED